MSMFMSISLAMFISMSLSVYCKCQCFYLSNVVKEYYFIRGYRAYHHHHNNRQHHRDDDNTSSISNLQKFIKCNPNPSPNSS